MNTLLKIKYNNGNLGFLVLFLFVITNSIFGILSLYYVFGQKDPTSLIYSSFYNFVYNILKAFILILVQAMIIVKWFNNKELMITDAFIALAICHWPNVLCCLLLMIILAINPNMVKYFIWPSFILSAALFIFLFIKVFNNKSLVLLIVLIIMQWIIA
jgi:hypothetical protein